MNTIGFFVLFAVSIITAKNIPNYDLESGPEYFEDFIKKYNKRYDNEEEKAKRYNIFLKNLEEVNFLNENSENAQYGINKFSDLTKAEFNGMYKGYVKRASSLNCTAEARMAEDNNEVADSFDWRTKGVVTDVKDQDKCGGCWAFGAIANLESVNAIKTGKLLDLSEQQVIDCDKRSYGCDGGDQAYAMGYLAEYGSINEKDYPFVAKDQKCQYDAGKVAVKIKGCSSFHIKDENEVAKKLSGIAPLAIGVASDWLVLYQNGIITANRCKVSVIDHVVLLVGYGTEKGVPYWIVKNSWSPDWGEKGYFRMQRGVNCLNFTSDEMVTAVMD